MDKSLSSLWYINDPIVENILPKEIPRTYKIVNNKVKFSLAQNSKMKPLPTLKVF